MSIKFTRRATMAAVGGSAAGWFSPMRGQAQYPATYNPGRSAFWEPGPNKSLNRDLKPGTTTVRLGGSLTVAATEAAVASRTSPPPTG
jgi:hypothetical protein